MTRATEHTHRPFVLALFMLGLGVLPLFGQAGAKPPFEAPDTYPLGGIEALVLPAEDGLRVQSVFVKGLAEKGGLLVGDRITGLNGQPLSGKPKEQALLITTAIEEAEGTVLGGRKFGQVKIDVVGPDGKPATRVLPVRILGPHAAECPTRCKRCTQMIEEALEYLAQKQSGEGHFPDQMANGNQAVATAALAGLAFLGHPQGWKRYGTNIQKAAQYVIANAGKDDGRRLGGEGGGPNWNQENWAHAYGAILLGELVHHRPKAEWKKKLGEMAATLARHQEKSGGWAHGPGGVNALGYIELEIMSNFALGAMGLAERAGLQIEKAAQLRGIEWMRKCTIQGQVHYSPPAPEFASTPHGDSGRTAGAYWALRQCDAKGELPDGMATFYAANIELLYEGHACPTMHLLNGALASSLIGQGSWQKWWKVWRPFIIASRKTAGAFDCQPNLESKQMEHHPDRAWGDTFVTTHYLIAMQAGQGRYKALDVVIPPKAE